MHNDRRLKLERKISSDQGTFGRLFGAGLSLYTAELPWRENRPGLSCIPAGVYSCRHYSSVKYPDSYEIMRVDGREAILLHEGNFAGDVHKGLKSDVEGCILVGCSAGRLDGQSVVLKSREAMERLREWAGKKEGFILEIE